MGSTGCCLLWQGPVYGRGLSHGLERYDRAAAHDDGSEPKAKDLGVAIVKAGILRYAQNDQEMSS